MAINNNTEPVANHDQRLELNQTATGSFAADLELAARCRNGDDTAFKHLVARLENKLHAILIRRGATETAARDLVADLWSDCFAVAAGGSSLLAKYSGKSSLDTWLATVLTHRWLDQIRRNRRVEPLEDEPPEEAHAQPEPRFADAGLARLIYGALRHSFGRCDPELFVMLQLVHVHGIPQRIMAINWGVSESKISRRLSKAMECIHDDTVAWLREKEPMLRLEWDDLADLCSAGNMLEAVAGHGGRKPDLLQSRPRQTSV
jgi:RNA polymerase sigma factor (sigma-70 family)